jgi:uncharacterized protein
MRKSAPSVDHWPPNIAKVTAAGDGADATTRGVLQVRAETQAARSNLGVVRRMLSIKSARGAAWFAFTSFWISIALLGAFFIPTGVGAHAASIQPLEIVTKAGVHVFSVEMATTEEEKTTGLMYRKELPEGKGMLFDFSPEQEVSMWMKNTYIPLDMIFIRADGRILRIAENTEPLSTKIIPSRGLAKGVLEVIGGTAQKYGIQPGDRVAHPLFNAK